MLSSASLLADQVVKQIDGVPAWLTELGLPLALLVCVSWALILVAKAFMNERAARIKDRDDFLAAYRHEADKAMESRNSLVLETQRQTTAFERLEKSIHALVGKISSRPCLLESERGQDKKTSNE